MTQVLFDGVLETDYGRVDLVWAEDGGFDGEWERFFAGQVNGLVGAGDPRGVYFHLGRRSGGSKVRIVASEAVPVPAPAHFDDVVEVSVLVPPGAEVALLAWGEMTGVLLGFPTGSLRLRVSSSGRDAGHEGEFAEGVVDEYLVEVWPAPPGPDAILRVGSDSARYWHGEWGGRR